MSTRVCSPPTNIMDITRDNLGCPNPGNPTSGSLPVSSATQSPTPSSRIFPTSTSTGNTTGMTTLNVEFNIQRKSVARSLFGPPDPSSRDYARKLATQMREEDSKKWNFNFETEKPLEGRYKWEPVTCVTTASSTASSVPKAYARMPYIYHHQSTASCTETTTSTGVNVEERNLDRDVLLAVRTVDQDATASSGFCPPPTPIKCHSPENRAFSPDRIKRVSNHPSSSSVSSQSSPESSTEVVIEPPISIPSPPSSLEECSPPPSFIEDDDNNSREKVKRSKSSKMTSQPPITQYMPSRKRPAHTLTQGTTSPSSEKKAAL